MKNEPFKVNSRLDDIVILSHVQHAMRGIQSLVEIVSSMLVGEA
jgi:hypothetical protein